MALSLAHVGSKMKLASHLRRCSSDPGPFTVPYFSSEDQVGHFGHQPTPRQAGVKHSSGCASVDCRAEK
eukprot:5724390-Pyramimonas_sp.AAC.1